MADSLTFYLRSNAPVRWARGTTDCVQWAAKWIEEITGERPGAHLAYSTDDEAEALLRAHHGIRALFREVLDDFPGIVEVEEPRRGDIGIVRLKGVNVGAICTRPGEWAVKTRCGTVIGPMKHLRAWRVLGANGAAGAEVIGALVISLFTAVTTVTVASSFVIAGTTISTALIVGTIVLTAAGIGLQYLLSEMQKPDSADPTMQQQSLRQAVGPRVIHYGRVKVGGTFAFYEARSGLFCRTLMTGARRISSVVEHWLNSYKVTLQTPPFPPGGGADHINEPPLNKATLLYFRLGENDSEPYQKLIDVFPGDYTTAHKLNGISTVLLVLGDPGPEEWPKTFQSGIPNYRQVIDSSLVYDPRDPLHNPNEHRNDGITWTYQDNAGVCILDYMTNPDGFGLTINDMDLGSFSAFADLCDSLVARKTGGFERRYRIAGSYHLSEMRKEPLKRMLLTCDARIVQLPNGLIGIAGGKYEAPEATIDNTVIMSRSWEFGADITERVNELKPTFLSADHDYQETEAAAWSDPESISADGLIPQTYSVVMCPSHSQAQRLAKIVGRRINSPIRGEISCNLGGIIAFQQGTVRIIDDTVGIDDVFFIEKFDFVFSSDGGALRIGVNLRVVKVDASDWAWDAGTEEGDAPIVPPDTSSASDIPVPQNVGATVEPVVVSGGVVGGQLRVSWDPAAIGQNPFGSPVAEIRYRNKTGPATFGPYVVSRTLQGQTEFISQTIQNDGTEYEIEVRFIVGSGAPGDWSDLVIVVASADPTAPDPVEDLAWITGGGAGEIDIAWTAPNSSNFAAARVYTNTVDSLIGATLRATRFGAPNAAQFYTITGLAAGSYWVLVTAINGSGVASGPESITATAS